MSIKFVFPTPIQNKLVRKNWHWFGVFTQFRFLLNKNQRKANYTVCPNTTLYRTLKFTSLYRTVQLTTLYIPVQFTPYTELYSLQLYTELYSFQPCTVQLVQLFTANCTVVKYVKNLKILKSWEEDAFIPAT